MHTLLIVLAAVVAVAAAVRSTWSPCGQSMLSTITPLAERTRGHRFGVTATWFVVGATAGGATLGAGTAVLAAVASAFFDTTSAAVAVAFVCAAIAAASDGRVFGRSLPIHCRQVNELWLNRYRPWVYGAGFGWQIGVGVATFIMTAGVYLMITLATLTASPAVAFGIGVLFGFTRGLAVFGARRITTPEALASFHRRFDALGPATRRAMIAVELFVAVVAAAAAFGAIAGAVLVVVSAVAFSARRHRTTPEPAGRAHHGSALARASESGPWTSDRSSSLSSSSSGSSRWGSASGRSSTQPPGPTPRGRRSGRAAQPGSR
jgi:MFS family permease